MFSRTSVEPLGAFQFVVDLDEPATASITGSAWASIGWLQGLRSDLMDSRQNGALVHNPRRMRIRTPQMRLTFT
jgi:hypothetical protein